MLSGLKFIPRDEVERSQDKELEGYRKERKKSKSRKDKGRHKRRSSRYSSDEDLERIKSRKKKKWHASDDESFSSSDGSESNSEYDEKERSSSSKRRKEKKRRKARVGDGNLQDSGDGSQVQNLNDNLRKQMGLDFMLRPKHTVQKAETTLKDNPQEVQVEAEEVKKVNPKELNPYLKENGSGYPEDPDGNAARNQLFSSSLVGDGGASWRLKALKRAQEQAAREGRDLEEVVKDRWGSVGQLAVSVAAHKVAPTHAHLGAIKSRRNTRKEGEQTDTTRQNEMFNEKDGFSRKAEMRMPTVQDSLSWKKHKMRTADSSLSAAISTINKFSNDGSFIREFMNKKDDHSGDPLDSPNTNTERGIESNSVERSNNEGVSVSLSLTANQLAAKVLQLRMKGKHEEAEKLLKEAEDIKAKSDAEGKSHEQRIDGSTSRYIMHDFSARQKMKKEDADVHLAQKIMQNQQYKVSGQADDEYDYDGGPRRKSRKKGRDNNDHKSSEMSQITKIANRMLTQKERCQFCFENPTRPKHLVVAIANFTYLSLPHWQPVVPGHCCILTLQHESSTRAVDDNVWDEIRNFKKCLIMMFANQDKDLVFLETVMGLAQQRRHCLVECIPLPKEIAKQGPLYFKKAIDEAEEEWSQHNAKKLIDTSQKGLRGSIPKNFPYFHVEFGLNKGFVHVVDDETQFKSNFGLNVIRGMLRMPAEDMHSRRKHESPEMQKQSVASFARDWEPFDWTKQLD